MKRLLVFTLIFCIFGQAFVRTAWMLYYQWNLETYIEQCENKARPSLHCNGKCHLKKQIAASENQDPSKPALPNSFQQFKDVQLFFEPLTAFPALTEKQDEVAALPHYQVFLSDAPVAGVFRPPSC